jgi:8-oxo-dGTP pyrophosphatase MutT (NUDIX family)
MLRPLATLVNRALRLYWRVRKPVTFGVRAIVLHRDGRLLLVKHTYDRYWYLPGGGRKRDEEPEEAIQREVSEEIGIAALAIERKLGTYFSEREGKRDTIDVFVARAEEFGRLQRLEIAACEWFEPDALPPDASPATQRRIAEFLGRRAIEPGW